MAEKKGRILVVDDAPAVTENLRLKIARSPFHADHEVLTAQGAEEALRLFEQEQPAIVISDIRMPGMDGLNMIRRMQQLREGCGYLILSGYDDFHLVREAFLLGVSDYILKPVDMEELCDKLARLHNARQTGRPALAAPPQPPPSGGDTLMVLALRYIQENIRYASLNMRMVSDHLNISYGYFSKLFKLTMQESFPDHLHRCRIALAKEYLRDPREKVVDIARKVGYESGSALSRAFKQFEGCYPTEYREGPAGGETLGLS